MSYIACADRARRHRVALLTICAFAAALSAAPAMAGCNSGDTPNTDLLSSTNCRANASGTYATAVGGQAQASGLGSSAFGYSATAKGANATAIGRDAGPLDPVAGSTYVGAYSGYSGAGPYSTAVGGGIYVGGSGSTASFAQGNFSIAIGGGNGVVFTPSIGPAINLNGARATGFISMAFGPGAEASGGGSSAFGLGSKATAANSSAFGLFSTASRDSSVAIGLFSAASGVSSIALGRGASATNTRSVAIGYGSIANVANTVSVGSNAQRRRIVNVAAAVNPNDAVNLAQAQALAAAARSPRATGDMRQELTALRAMVNRLDGIVERQQEEIAELKARNAAAAAASGL